MSTNSNTNNESSKKNIRFPHSLTEKIEAHKDPLIPFAAWVKSACEEKLERETTQGRTSKPVDTVVSRNTPVGVQSANEKRMLEAKERLLNAIELLTPEQKEDINNSRYSKNALYLATGKVVSKDVIRKHWGSLDWVEKD